MNFSVQNNSFSRPAIVSQLVLKWISWQPSLGIYFFKCQSAELIQSRGSPTVLASAQTLRSAIATRFVSSGQVIGYNIPRMLAAAAMTHPISAEG
jgi:hypothetical protein